jgi:hypothetical protein
MRRFERAPESLFGLETGSVDSNRFYSILLDARASSVSENMCDIAEKLLVGEKENAKIALEQLWNLKKNLLTENTGTIDLLINFYQVKMDVLRNKEERIKNVSRDSRTLIEEKRKRDEEIATVKQLINDSAKELDELTSKLETLKTKEQELILIEQQLKKELNTNENEIVNGLYEIILTQQERIESDEINKRTILETVSKVENTDSMAKQNEPDCPETKITEPKVESLDDHHEELALDCAVSEQVQQVIVNDIPIYPKSVVKTTRGRVIGEYYYDGKVYKNERHYIFNSKFFSDHLANSIKLLKQRFDQTLYSEILQMIQDSYKRIAENKRLHFEVSTNEILNDKALKQIWQDAKLRQFDDVERFCLRLRAKIDTLGNNYRAMLQEQMKRCLEN